MDEESQSEGKPKKVFVSGCFDILHSGHIAFFKDAAKLGEVYVSIGSDDTIKGLKGRDPHMNENERLLLVTSLKFIKEGFIGSGSGMLDFEPELRKIMPDIFLVNEDGDTPEKKKLCESLGIEYIVKERVPLEGFPKRSSTQIKSMKIK